MMDAPLTNELLLDVYTALADSKTWQEFINDPRLEPLGSQDLYDKHDSRYNAVYEAHPFHGRGPLFMYIPKWIGELVMRIDVYRHENVDPGYVYSWLKLAGRVCLPLFTIDMRTTYCTIAVTYDITALEQLVKNIRKARLSDEGFRHFKEDILRLRWT